VTTQKILSVAMLATLALVAVCTGLMVNNLRGFPAVLENDAYSRSILGTVYYEGHEPAYSDQTMMREACLEAAQAQDKPPELDQAILKCELNVRANPDLPGGYEVLATLYAERGDAERARKLKAVGARLRN
jgi:hypothetical protein